LFFTLAHLLPMLVAEQVEEAVRERPAPVVADDLGAEDDVASARGTPSASSSRPSIGNESTSVASSIPR